MMAHILAKKKVALDQIKKIIGVQNATTYFWDQCCHQQADGVLRILASDLSAPRFL